jgi:hypothetical protein
MHSAHQTTSLCAEEERKKVLVGWPAAHAPLLSLPDHSYSDVLLEHLSVIQTYDNLKGPDKNYSEYVPTLPS